MISEGTRANLEIVLREYERAVKRWEAASLDYIEKERVCSLLTIEAGRLRLGEDDKKLLTTLNAHLIAFSLVEIALDQACRAKKELERCYESYILFAAKLEEEKGTDEG